MPILEPPADLDLWPKVRDLSGWPAANEDLLRTMAEGWQSAQAAVLPVVELDHQAVAPVWADGVGAAFQARLVRTRTAAAAVVRTAGALARMTQIYADQVTTSKTYIRGLIETNLPIFERVVEMQPRVDEDVIGPFVGKLAEKVRESLEAVTRAVSAAPAIPDVPPPPPNDSGLELLPDGAVPPTLEDIFLEDAVRKAAALISPLYPNASRNFQNFLDGNGDPVVLSTEDVTKDVPRLQDSINEQLDAQLARVAAGSTGVDVPFTTGWQEFNITPDDNKDWHYAIGNVHHTVTGVARVLPPEVPGGPQRVEVEYQVHLYDRYNFDPKPGKAADLGGIPLPDTTFNKLVYAGLAKEFDIVGEPGTTHREIRELPS